MMRLAVVGFSCLFLILVGCSTGNAKYGNPTTPSSSTAAPVFSLAAGTYNSVRTVSITDATAGAAIYFTTNGAVPTASSTPYTGPITVSSTETLMAVAIAPGDASSTVETAAYTITLAPDGKVMHGNTPVSGAHVYLFAAKTDGYGNASVSLLNSAVTGASDTLGGYVTTATDGSFTISGMYKCTPNTQVYAYALEGNAGSGENAAPQEWLAILGNCPQSGSFTINPSFTMNEVTTVDAAYVLAGFANDGLHVYILALNTFPLVLGVIAVRFFQKDREFLSLLRRRVFVGGIVLLLLSAGVLIAFTIHEVFASPPVDLDRVYPVLEMLGASLLAALFGWCGKGTSRMLLVLDGLLTTLLWHIAALAASPLGGLLIASVKSRGC